MVSTSTSPRLRRPKMPGQVDRHHGTLALFATQDHVATGLPDKAVNHRQAKPGALARRFGREERVKGTRDHVRGHAQPVSVTNRLMYSPAAPTFDTPRESGTILFLVSINRWPPSGMASRALRTRLSQRGLLAQQLRVAALSVSPNTRSPKGAAWRIQLHKPPLAKRSRRSKPCATTSKSVLRNP